MRRVKENVELPVAVVADALGISSRSVYRLLESGLLVDRTLVGVVAYVRKFPNAHGDLNGD